MRNGIQNEFTSSKRLRVNVFRAAVAIALLSLLVGNLPVAAEGRVLPSRLVWSSGFETGISRTFNDTSIQDQPSGVALSISTQVAHTGSYSAYYSYVGSQNPGLDYMAGFPTEILSQRLPTFYVQFWVYVPSKVNGQQVHLTSDWICFAGLWVNQGGSDTGGRTINVNSDSSQELRIHVHMLDPSPSAIVYQSHPVKWAFNEWFSIGIYGELHPGTANSKLIIYQNGQEIISWVGDLGLASDGLGQMHFGLYASNTQGTIGFYNDDLEVYA
jgi:hypothetical protein